MKIYCRVTGLVGERITKLLVEIEELLQTELLLLSQDGNLEQSDSKVVEIHKTWYGKWKVLP